MPASAATALRSVSALNKFCPAARPGLGLALLALALAGCAQQRSPGYYNTGHDNTLSDAQQQAQGRNTARAPSQIQLGFGDTEKKPRPGDAAPEAAEQSAAAATPVVRPLMEAKTFLGTVPCLTGESACTAARVTLTLAPNGEWRSRTQILQPATGKKAPVAELGCWSPIGMDPWRILLKSQDGRRNASLTFVNDNVLRINAVNDIQPTLNYHLTRQANVDGIDELANHPSLKCRG